MFSKAIRRQAIDLLMCLNESNESKNIRIRTEPQQ